MAESNARRVAAWVQDLQGRRRRVIEERGIRYYQWDHENGPISTLAEPPSSRHESGYARGESGPRSPPGIRDAGLARNYYPISTVPRVASSEIDLSRHPPTSASQRGGDQSGDTRGEIRLMVAQRLRAEGRRQPTQMEFEQLVDNAVKQRQRQQTSRPQASGQDPRGSSPTRSSIQYSPRETEPIQPTTTRPIFPPETAHYERASATMSGRSRLFVPSGELPTRTDAAALRTYLGRDVIVKETDNGVQGEHGFSIETTSVAAKQKIEALRTGRPTQQQGRGRPQGKDPQDLSSSQPETLLLRQAASQRTPAEPARPPTMEPSTISSRAYDPARIRSQQAEYKEAERISRRALIAREKVLGFEHPDTLDSVDVLATILQKQGKNEAAEEMHRRALAVREKVLGLKHPNTLESVDVLAKILQKQGKYEAAKAIHRRALAAGNEKVLGVEHPDTLTSVHNLAFLLRKQEYEVAEEMFRRDTDGLRRPGRDRDELTHRMDRLDIRPIQSTLAHGRPSDDRTQSILFPSARTEDTQEVKPQRATQSDNSLDYFLPREGIEWVVIRHNISKYLGDEATVRPFNKSVPGYLIKAPTRPTIELITELKRASARYKAELAQAFAGINQIRSAPRSFAERIPLTALPSQESDDIAAWASPMHQESGSQRQERAFIQPLLIVSVYRNFQRARVLSDTSIRRNVVSEDFVVKKLGAKDQIRDGARGSSLRSASDRVKIIGTIGLIVQLHTKKKGEYLIFDVVRAPPSCDMILNPDYLFSDPDYFVSTSSHPGWGDTPNFQGHNE